MAPILKKYLPLDSGTSKNSRLQDQRRKDHYSHFILRLVFSDGQSNREVFSRLESMLFRMRFDDDDHLERKEFVKSLNLDWEDVSDEEKKELASDLNATFGFRKGEKRGEEQDWFKVDFTRVPELVEHRKVLLQRGKAYVLQREQASLVVSEFQTRLNEALEVSTLL